MSIIGCPEPLLNPRTRNANSATLPYLCINQANDSALAKPFSKNAWENGETSVVNFTHTRPPDASQGDENGDGGTALSCTAIFSCVSVAPELHGPAGLGRRGSQYVVHVFRLDGRMPLLLIMCCFQENARSNIRKS